MEYLVEIRDIPTHPGYRIDSNGIPWTELRRVGSPFKHIRSGVWRPLKPRLLENGYLRVTLYLNGKRHCKSIHRLALETFIGKCPVGMIGCHNDGNKANNSILNLRWDTPRNNQLDRRVHGTSIDGEQCGRSKLTLQQIEAIFLRRAEGALHREIAQEFGICKSNVGQILSGQTWALARTKAQIELSGHSLVAK